MKNVVKFLVVFAIIFISVIIIIKDDNLKVAKAIAEGIIKEIKDELNGR